MPTSSSRTAALVVLATLGATLAACDAILGLGGYGEVDCALDCGSPEGSGAIDDGGEAGLDATVDVFEASAFDASDAGDASDASDGDAPSDGPWLPDVTLDAPSVVSEWAQWPMPNPLAPIAPDAATLLPNPMAYDAGADGGASTVFDNVTGLTWWSSASPASSLQTAAGLCASLPGGAFHVPTRIQLASLIDFTRPSVTLDTTVFHGVDGGAFWTSSPVIKPPTGPTGATWTVDFGTGLTSNTASGVAVLCVEGGP